jgi:hypothetical protein
MSRLKALATILAWWLAFAILYAAETADWPEARHWHMLDWNVWALGAVNAIVICSVVGFWKSLRKGDE